MYHLQKLHQDPRSNLGRPITPSEIEAGKYLLTWRAQRQIVLAENSSRLSKKYYFQYFLKLFNKIKTEGAMSYSFCEATVTVLHKPHKEYTHNLCKKQKLQTNFLYKERCKNSQQNACKINFKRSFTMTK